VSKDRHRWRCAGIAIGKAVLYISLDHSDGGVTVLQEKTATLFGIAAIVLMALLFILVFFQLVPPAWEVPLFIAAIVLFTIRLVLRALIARRKRTPEPPGDPA
jgi:hypothetical protein